MDTRFGSTSQVFPILSFVLLNTKCSSQVVSFFATTTPEANVSRTCERCVLVLLFLFLSDFGMIVPSVGASRSVTCRVDLVIVETVMKEVNQVN